MFGSQECQQNDVDSMLSIIITKIFQSVYYELQSHQRMLGIKLKRHLLLLAFYNCRSRGDKD